MQHAEVFVAELIGETSRAGDRSRFEHDERDAVLAEVGGGRESDRPGSDHCNRKDVFVQRGFLGIVAWYWL